jgi:hypothetical protein
MRIDEWKPLRSFLDLEGFFMLLNWFVETQTKAEKKEGCI